ncbi:MAG: hypothetical protein OXR68_08320 [Alphaproteobacteria bacterium]|nr:hypothetical protein [Alphaproteobacteria bacterium]MDD9920610.1 hypothetical protein [Alphaproteobacteria bacterium]
MKFLLLLCLSFFAVLPQGQAVPKLSAPEQQEEARAGFFILKPIKQQLIKWNIVINREIPKRMKALKNEPSFWVVLTSMLAALAYGIFHTLGPGHGKMVVGTYFLTHGAHFWRGVLMGIQVAFSHVAGAVVLVFAADIAMRQLLTDPEAQIFWVRTFSYSLIILIGLFMLVQAARRLLGQQHAHSGCSHCNHQHDLKQETMLSWCVGAVPCTGSLLILLYAMAHDILWLGLAMVFCIGVGMALTMIVIGWLCILGKKCVIDRYLNRTTKTHRWQALLEILGALFIMLFGVLLLSVVVM